MKRKVSVGACIILMIMSAFVAVQITSSYMTNKYESVVYGYSKWSDINSDLDTIEAIAGNDAGTNWQNVYTDLSEVDAYVRTNYVGDIDEENLRDFVLAGYLYGTGDKYAAYMPEEEYKAYTESFEGSIVGVGIRITDDVTTGGMYVTSVVPEGPAEKAGIITGDIIVAVDGNLISEYGYYNAYNLIREGKENEPVMLQVLTSASQYTESKDYTLVRSKVQTDTVITRMIHDDIGYVNILSFDMTTGNEFKNAMDALAKDGAKKYIFDVRNNPGGTIVGVRDVLDYLLPEGPVIRCFTKNGEETAEYSDAKELAAPMVVITNGNTASGGELFTAALRDYEKATVIGTTTYGKGTVQTIFPISNGGGVKLSVMMYNPPISDNYEGVGIVPDKTVELSNEAMANFYRLTDEEDTQLQAAIDEIINK